MKLGRSPTTACCLQALLGPAGAVPTLVLVSGADECVPEGADIAALASKIASAIGANASLEMVLGAPHNLCGHEEQCATCIEQFLARSRC